MSVLRMGELFAGYGGLGMGVTDVLDVELAWVSEFDKGANKILAHRFPDVPNHGDITKIDWTQVEPVDVLTGGSPCQDLSHAGKRAGMTEGTRSNLWVAMREAIAALRPSLVIWENVRGAYSAEAASGLVDDARLLADTRRRDGEPVLRALGRVLGDLSDLGYDASWHGLRAADVGAPHGRFRVFIVAYPAADARRIAREVPTARRLAAEPQPAGDGNPGRVGLTLLPTPAVNDMGAAYTPDEWDVWTDRMKAEHGNGNGHGKSLHIEAQRLLPTPKSIDSTGIKTSQRAKDLYSSKDSMGDIVEQQTWGQYAAAIARWEALTRPAPSPTETGPKGNPRLSAAFSEWLMGLPAGWVTDVPGITRNEALKALGNGVVPQQAETAVRFLLNVAVAA